MNPNDTPGVRVVPPGGLTAQEYLAKVEADPKRAEALQRARERAAGGVSGFDGKAGSPKDAAGRG